MCILFACISAIKASLLAVSWTTTYPNTHPVGKNSQNSAHLRIIRTAPAMRRRKRELFAKIRICDVGSPAQMRIIFRKKVLGFEKMRRVFAVGSPAQMRSIFRR